MTYWSVRSPRSGELYWVVADGGVERVRELVQASSLYVEGEQHPLQTREPSELPGPVLDVATDEGIYDEQGRTVG